jgi:hypothetical protein
VQERGHGRVGELVVGGPGDDRAPQLRNDVAGQDAAKGCGNQHVDLGGEGLAGLGPRRAQFGGQRPPAGVDVADRQLGAGGGELAGQVTAHAAQAEDRHRA